ncbi:outer membrane protein assembly factor BamE [Psychrosphaera sp. B3R10]|uniref:Outer membrane protein assembly factor BamE n=1 Tax=Psychrosphaera algicola TaxID=3023714 RepID=A0ABT5FIY7_9GAMM|nr:MULTISPECIES: outer membrane protein assembly factor BamE [unclassified Psychrosphaera]MBU2882860.1 outer membrane protein assembly factor BamE [Psychrosphaera sp. I2R16]MBU2990401.1 outer membrane protein assembly factor BamE [Psychrosphaera sp. B3R10]MDC2891152.1 outer membrane protein assembly factor BamE [Psychrosphaera sp. G1-22]MDO6718626.1 outer membrane protein assembly factor BamE [Psychrosphaera sp. 1_MG-2023]
MKIFLAIFISLALSACSTWVYKYDITQGNFLNQDDVNKLRVEMTQEQVKYVLGTPVLENPFSSDKWHYIHTNKSGKTDITIRRELIIIFKDGKLFEIEGDYKRPEQFETPLES